MKNYKRGKRVYLRRDVSERTEMYKKAKVLAKQGLIPDAAAPILGISKAHSHRIYNHCGIRKYWLTPDEIKAVEAIRKDIIKNI